MHKNKCNSFLTSLLPSTTSSDLPRREVHYHNCWNSSWFLINETPVVYSCACCWLLHLPLLGPGSTTPHRWGKRIIEVTSQALIHQAISWIFLFNYINVYYNKLLLIKISNRPTGYVNYKIFLLVNTEVHCSCPTLTKSNTSHFYPATYTRATISLHENSSLH